MANPPAVHDGAPGGVWSTDRGCYEFLARMMPSDAVTLETGLGISTVLFALWSGSHVCVVPSGDEVARLHRYGEARGIDFTNVHFEVGFSDQVLPSMQMAPVDLYLVDGGHGFPHPALDWYYGSLLLRADGLVVIDDIQLPAVHDYLVKFLLADDRWLRVGGDDFKWIAFRKQADFSVREEWDRQSFLGAPRPVKPPQPWLRRIKIAGRRQLSRLKRP